MLRLVKSAVQLNAMLSDIHRCRQLEPALKKSLMGLSTSNGVDISDDVAEVLEAVIEMLTFDDHCEGGAA